MAGTTTLRLAYDGLDRIAEYNGANALQRRYVFGPGMDAPIVWYAGATVSSTTRRFLSSDERGSIVSVTNSAGALLGIDSYDEYGMPGSANLGAFGYTGQAWLPTVGMWYYKARIYSPTAGRFLQTDPIGYGGGGPNLYNYVLSDPVNLSDPLGLAGAKPPPPCDPATTQTGCGDIIVTGHSPDEIIVTAHSSPPFGDAAVLAALTGSFGLPELQLPAFGGGQTIQTCPIVMAKITGVGPNQAAGDQRTSISGERGRDINPSAGGVAIDPLDFGVPSAGPYRSALQSVVILPLWEFAGHPSNGASARPIGLPSGGPYRPIDVIAPASLRNQPGLQLDLYRYANQDDALSSTRKVPVIPIIPAGAGLSCPSGK